MVTQQLLDYVRQQFSVGVAKDGIKNALTAQGWGEQDINEAFITAGELNTQVLQPSVLAVATMQTELEKVSGNKNKWFLIGAIVVALVLLGIGTIFVVPSIKAFVLSKIQPIALVTDNEVALNTLNQIDGTATSTSPIENKALSEAPLENQDSNNPPLTNMAPKGYVLVPSTPDENPVDNTYTNYLDTSSREQLKNYNIYVFKSSEKTADGTVPYNAFIKLGSPLPSGLKYGLMVLKMKCTGSVAVKMIFSGDVCQKSPISGIEMNITGGGFPMFISGTGEVYFQFYVVQTAQKPIMLLHKGVSFKVEPAERLTEAEVNSLNSTNSIKKDFSNLQLFADAYFTYEKGFTGVCQDGKIKDYMNAISSVGGKVSCLDSKNAYRMSSPLPDKRILCIDADGRYTTTGVPQAGSFICPDS